MLEAVVIEDEDAVRQAIVQTLELGGFTVHACASAEQAQPWLRPEFSGVVVTDVRLPGNSGLQVLAQITELDEVVSAVAHRVNRHADMAMARHDDNG